MRCVVCGVPAAGKHCPRHREQVNARARAVYALRRELFVPLPAGTILDDMWVPLHVVFAGQRIAMARDAIAFCSPPGIRHRRLPMSSRIVRPLRLASRGRGIAHGRESTDRRLRPSACTGMRANNIAVQSRNVGIVCPNAMT